MKRKPPHCIQDSKHRRYLSILTPSRFPQSLRSPKLLIPTILEQQYVLRSSFPPSSDLLTLRSRGIEWYFQWFYSVLAFSGDGSCTGSNFWILHVRSWGCWFSWVSYTPDSFRKSPCCFSGTPRISCFIEVSSVSFLISFGCPPEALGNFSSCR